MIKYHYIIFSILFIIFYLGLSILTPGGLFVLDFVITPFTTGLSWYATSIQWHIVDIVNYIFGYELTSKLYFIVVFIFGLFVSSKLGKNISYVIKYSLNIWIIQAITAIFLICNPWTYERLITQPGIAMGMFAIALGISYLIQNILTQNKYSLILAALSFGIAFMLFPHASLLIMLIGVVYAAVFFRDISLKFYILSPLIIILPSINWLIGDLFYGKDLGTSYVQTFDIANLQGFMGNSLSGLGIEITHLLLYGFWGERFHILTPNSFNQYWYIFGFIALVFIVWGNIKLFYLQRKLWIFFSSIAFISYVLALGIASNIFGDINLFLYNNIPGYIGMREPQKWLCLTMISYCIFFVIGIIALKEKFKSIQTPILLLIVFVILNTWNPLNLFGYQGQLYGSVIPSEYSELALSESSMGKDGKYLILPWHTYMSCEWTRGKTIASMQEKIFFPLDTIVADNLEIHGKYTNSNSEVSKDVESYLTSRDISLLKKNGITHIIYQKNCGNSPAYGFLEENNTLNSITDNEFISLYKIQYEK